jgi:hypothetical protein
MAHVKTGEYEVSDPETRERVTLYISNASPESVATVLAADEHAEDGDARSQWVWLRTPNGDLVLAVFPQDGTYFATELDHSS